MPRYSLEINDVAYPWESLYYKRSAPFTEDPITAIIPGKQSVTGEDKIEILEDAVVKTTGRVHSFGYVKGRDGISTKIIGSTLERDGAEIEVLNRITGVAQPQTIIQNNINLIATIKAVPRLSAGTLNVYGSILPFEFGADWESRWNIRDAFERIAQVTGWEEYVSPTGAVDFKASCGVDRGKTPAVSTTKFQSGENILRWTQPHFEDHTMISGEIIVIGRKEGVFQAYGSTGAGHPVRKYYFKDLHTPDTCVAASAAIDADMSNALETGRFNCIDAGLTYDVYDTVQIVDKDYGIDADYRIYELEKWISPEKVYASILYTNLTKMTGNGPLLIGRGKRTLVKGQEALKQVTTTPLSLRDEARLYKFAGEDTTGYTTGTVATGVITVVKDYVTLQTGVGLGRAYIYSPTANVSCANEIGFDFQFQINNLVDPAEDRRFWIGAFNFAANQGLYAYLQGFKLYGVANNGGATTPILLKNPIPTATWLRVSGFKRYGKGYFYYDSDYVGSVSTNLPTGTTGSVYMDQLANANANNRNYTTYIRHFEVSSKHNPGY